MFQHVPKNYCWNRTKVQSPKYVLLQKNLFRAKELDKSHLIFFLNLYDFKFRSQKITLTVLLWKFVSDKNTYKGVIFSICLDLLIVFVQYAHMIYFPRQYSWNRIEVPKIQNPSCSSKTFFMKKLSEKSDFIVLKPLKLLDYFWTCLKCIYNCTNFEKNKLRVL